MIARRSAGVKTSGLSIRIGRFAALCGLALACLAGVPAQAGGRINSTAPSAPAQANPFDATVRPLAVGDVLPDATYTDERGRPLRIADLRGKTVIVGFIYTNCADECPILTSKFAALASALPSDRFALLEISIDPARDTPEAIANFARAHGVHAPNWHILTGAPALLESFAKPLGISVIQGRNGELLHSERIVIVGPDGRIGYLIDDVTWTQAQAVAAARHVDGMPSSGLARFDLDLGKAVQAVCGGKATGHSGLAALLGVLGVFVAGIVVAVLVGRRIFAA